MLAVGVKRKGKQCHSQQSVEANFAQRLGPQPVLHQNAADAGRREKTLLEAFQPRARQEKKERAQDLDEIQAEQNLKVISRSGAGFGILRLIVILGSLHRQTIQLVVQQMAQPQDTKRRAEKNRQQSRRQRIDGSVRVKQIVNRFVNQAPKRIGQHRQQRQRPCPAHILRQQPQRQHDKLEKVDRTVEEGETEIQRDGNAAAGFLDRRPMTASHQN